MVSFPDNDVGTCTPLFRYNLAQEYGDLINLHDWYQSFKATTVGSYKTKRKVKQSPASKKMKVTPESEALTQYPLTCSFYSLFSLFPVQPIACDDTQEYD